MCFSFLFRTWDCCASKLDLLKFWGVPCACWISYNQKIEIFCHLWYLFLSCLYWCFHVLYYQGYLLVSCFMNDPAKDEWWLLHSRTLKYEWYCDVQLRWNFSGIVILEFPLWIDLIAFGNIFSYCGTIVLVSHGCMIEHLQCINTELKLCSKYVSILFVQTSIVLLGN